MTDYTKYDLKPGTILKAEKSSAPLKVVDSSIDDINSLGLFTLRVLGQKHFVLRDIDYLKKHKYKIVPKNSILYALFEE